MQVVSNCQPYEYPEGLPYQPYPQPYQQPSGSDLPPGQRADLLIANLGHYDYSQRDAAQRDLLELGRQMLLQGDAAGFTTLLDKLEYASLRGDSDAMRRAAEVAREFDR